MIQVIPLPHYVVMIKHFVILKYFVIIEHFADMNWYYNRKLPRSSAGLQLIIPELTEGIDSMIKFRCLNHIIYCTNYKHTV